MVTIPQRRSPKDLTIQADIAEEIVRIYGFEKIEPQGIWQKQKETKVEPAV
jgi:phenylalanyl-tRNA synthetase beta subunit